MVVALIMLAIVTLIGTVSANIVMGNLRVVQNIEARAVAKSAAMSAIQAAISDPDVLLRGERQFRFDLTGDLSAGAAALNVTLSQPKCVSVKPILNRELEQRSDELLEQCLSAPKDPKGISDDNGQSECVDAVWEVIVTAVDPVTGARVIVRQGLTDTVDELTIANACDSAPSMEAGN